MLQHVIDDPASSSVAEEGVLIVYYEAVKIEGLVLIVKAEHRIQQQEELSRQPSICLLLYTNGCEVE